MSFVTSQPGHAMDIMTWPSAFMELIPWHPAGHGVPIYPHTQTNVCQSHFVLLLFHANCVLYDWTFSNRLPPLIFMECLRRCSHIFYF